MIIFQAVTYSYPHAPEPVLRDISCHIPSGSFALVVGASGAGKSTFVRCINGLVPHFTGGVLAGTIRVGGLDPVLLGPDEMSHLVGCVFQDPESQAVMDTVEDEIAFALEHTGMARETMRVRVEETLDLLELGRLRSRRLERLSGGERQRVAIAVALALRPRILVLDEPTSQLDPQSAEDVLQALVRLNHDLGLTIILVEHRLERVLPFIDLMITIDTQGQLQSGAPQQILEQLSLTPPLITLAKALGWSPLPLTIKEGLRFSRQLQLPLPKPAQHAAMERTEPVIEVEQLSAGYPGRPVLHDLSFRLAKGEIVALLGRNGAGKTTLLQCLVGLIRPAQGRIQVGGRDTAGLDVATICRQVGYVPQNPNALLFADTVREELQITLHNHRIVAPERINPLLETLQLAHKAQAYPRDLSVGERQRVALGAIMVTEPQALLLDEPTRGLDYAAKQRLAGLLRTWQAAGKAILIVTHDVEFAAELASRVIVLGEGRLIADGPLVDIIGASPLFAPQVARLFPGSGWLTPRDVLDALQPGSTG